METKTGHDEGKCECKQRDLLNRINLRNETPRLFDRILTDQ